MRIRQVKPAYWTDRTLASLSYPARLFYIGLWCVADDAGYIDWDLDELGALLFPYEVPHRRERHLSAWSVELVACGRVMVLDCGCAVIPTLEQHQRHAGGNRSYAARDRHIAHKSVQVQIDGAGTVGNGRERKGTVGNGSAPAKGSDNDETTTEFQTRMAALGVKH
jgi:hypothetical protein